MYIDQSPLMRQCQEATVTELSEEFRGVFSRETVARYVESAYEDLGDRPTVGPNFLPVIIARFAREQLWAAAQSDGRVEKALPEVLFVCELGVDVRLEFPKPMTDDVLRAANIVVTLGCGDACPVYPGKLYQDWPVADPARQPLEVVHRIRYELYHRVWDLLETLVPTNTLITIHGATGDRP